MAQIDIAAERKKQARESATEQLAAARAKARARFAHFFQFPDAPDKSKDNFLFALHSAMKEAEKIALDFAEWLVMVQADGDLSSTGKEKKIGEAYRKAQAELAALAEDDVESPNTPRLIQARNILRKLENEIAEKAGAHPTDAATAVRHAESRQLLMAMDKADRQRVLVAGFEQGDIELAQVYLGAPPFLQMSSLEGLREKAEALVAKHVSPHETKTASGIREYIERLENAKIMANDALKTAIQENGQIVPAGAS